MPKEIKKLSPDVINKIAAGQTILSPYYGFQFLLAIKQLVQNSIDAKSKSISITIYGNGYQQIIVDDNGKGIYAQDFQKLCQRFATSKIQEYQDLQNIQSYGFRGQALASLSYISQISVISRRQQNKLAYKAQFINGEIKGGIHSVHRNEGTIIICKNLFGKEYKIRKKTNKDPSQKKNIIRLIQVLSVQHDTIKFMLKDQNTVQYSNSVSSHQGMQRKLDIFSVINKIKCKDLFYTKFSFNQIQCQGIFSKLGCCKGQKTFTLFINERLVQNQLFQKKVFQAYQTCYKAIHTENMSFQVYLSIRVNPKNVDQNIHPTKKIVCLGQEFFIGEKIQEKIQERLKHQCSIKSFQVKKKISFGFEKKKAQYDIEKVRTDGSQLPLPYFFQKEVQEKKSQQIKNIFNEEIIRFQDDKKPKILQQK